MICCSMKYMLFLIFPSIIFGDTAFISAEEYATQLYKNPRGIGCHHCHGDEGEGKLVARYKHKGENKTFEGPSINSMEFQIFYRALNERKRGMPRYYLTQKEIKALYLHLHKEESNEQ